jgi:hypothetical protein
MANPSIRGHQGTFKYYENGVEVVEDSITNVSINQDSTFTRSMYVGNPIPEGDQSIEGWSGSIDCEVKNDRMDLFIDALVNNNLNGIGVSDYTFIHTENYGDGASASYVYFDCQFKMGKTQGGLSDKITRKLDFQASSRVRI